LNTCYKNYLKLKFSKIYKGLIIISVLVILIIGVFILRYYYIHTNYSHDNKQELELKYWECKSKIVDEIEEYINKKVKYYNISILVMLNACDKYDIDIRLPLSQGYLESRYGTVGLARRTNSVFNMGAFDGNSLDKVLNIYKYSHPNQSIEPYLFKLRNNYLGTTKTEKDLLIEFVTLGGARYASYNKYERELQLIWEDIDTTTNLDSLLNLYQFLKLELDR